LEDEFFKAITTAPTGKITPTVTYDKVKKAMTVDVSVAFTKEAEAKKGAYKIVCVVVEDSIKGTTAAYNQSNAYAGGASGVMGGYEKLANPVPAAKMVYNHTARAVLSSVDGDEIAVDPTAGKVAKLSYKYTVPANFREKYLEVVAILLNPDDFAGNAEIAVAKSFKTTATNDLSEHEAFQNLYPNPTNDKTYISLNLKESAEVAIEVTDINGRVVASRKFGNVQGDNLFPYDSSDLTAGVYFVRIHIGKEIVTKKLIKE
jgi:hypothetical protein